MKYCPTLNVSEDEVLQSISNASGDLSYSSDLLDTYRGKELKTGIKVYRKFFTPLEWTISNHRKVHTKCYMKIIVNSNDFGRILGVHYVGPNAGEILQGFSLALRLGATFDDLKDTVGIHPTSVERFCIFKKEDEGSLQSHKPVPVIQQSSLVTENPGKFSFNISTEKQQFSFSVPSANGFSFGAPAAPCDT